MDHFYSQQYFTLHVFIFRNYLHTTGTNWRNCFSLSCCFRCWFTFCPWPEVYKSTYSFITRVKPASSPQSICDIVHLVFWMGTNSSNKWPFALELFLLNSCHGIWVFPSPDVNQLVFEILSCFIFITLRTAARIDWKMIKFYFCCFTFHTSVNNSSKWICLLQVWNCGFLLPINSINQIICTKLLISLLYFTLWNYIEGFFSSQF